MQSCICRDALEHHLDPPTRKYMRKLKEGECGRNTCVSKGQFRKRRMENLGEGYTNVTGCKSNMYSN